MLDVTPLTGGEGDTRVLGRESTDPVDPPGDPVSGLKTNRDWAGAVG